MARDCSADNSICDNTGNSVWPRRVQSVLLVDPLHCYGDSLYVNALLHQLLEDTPTLDITVLTEKHLFDVYKHSGCRLKNYKSIKEVNEINLENFDLVIDLDYKDDTEWDFRRRFYGEKKQCVVTLSPVVKEAKIFTGWLNLKDKTHFGQRMAMVAGFVRSAVVGKCFISEDKQVCCSEIENCFLEPYLDIRKSNDAKRDNCIYINTQGSESERSFSQNQVNALVNWFNAQKKYKGLFYTGGSKYFIKETGTVINVKTDTFMKAAELAVGCRGVVSPDTSMVHVAFANKIPLLAVYALSKKEYPSGQYQFDVWKPRYDKATVLLKSCRTLREISEKDIINAFGRFIDSLDDVTVG